MSTKASARRCEERRRGPSLGSGVLVGVESTATAARRLRVRAVRRRRPSEPRVLDAWRYCASCWARGIWRGRGRRRPRRAERFATVLNWAGVISAAGCSNSSGLARNEAIRSPTTWPIRYRFATGNRPARSASPVGAWSRAKRAELSSCDAAVSVIAPRDRNQPTGLAAPSSAHAPEASRITDRPHQLNPHRFHRRQQPEQVRRVRRARPTGPVLTGQLP